MKELTLVQEINSATKIKLKEKYPAANTSRKKSKTFFFFFNHDRETFPSK